MDGGGLSQVLVALVGAFVLLDRGAALLERFGGRIVGLRRFDLSRARRMVEAEEERARLASLAAVAEPLEALAQQSTRILKQLEPNDGSSVADRVNVAVASAQEAAAAAGTAARAASRAEAVTGEVRAELREHIEQSRSVHGAIFARLNAQEGSQR